MKAKQNIKNKSQVGVAKVIQYVIAILFILGAAYYLTTSSFRAMSVFLFYAFLWSPYADKLYEQKINLSEWAKILIKILVTWLTFVLLINLVLRY